MYRIELTPGEVTVFRTIEELATGVRNGLITPKARIYHSATDKWLPIEFHPHYKQALELNGSHAADRAGHKHAAKAPKQPSPKPAAPKSGGSKPRSDGFTFLNVPLSPVTPVPKPKPRVADLPYIEEDAPAAQQPAARPSPEHAGSNDRVPSHDAAADHLSVEHSPAYDAPAESTRAGHAPVELIPPVEYPTAHGSTVDHAAADQPSSVGAAAHDTPIKHSPDYDLDHQSSRDHPPERARPDHDAPGQHAPEQHAPEQNEPDFITPAHHWPVERAAVYEAAPAPHQPFKHILADETPIYRSPAERSATHEAEAHAAFEAHLTPEPVRIEEPIRDAPRSRLAVEELFSPPAPREPALPPVSASPVLELPTISYPEFTPVDPPVAERSSGGSRARRTLHLAGAVLLLAAGGYASTTVFSFGRADGGFNAASTMADRPVAPVRPTAPVPTPAPASARVGPQATMTSSAPARVESPRASSPKQPSIAGPLGSSAPSTIEAPLPPASSGFAPALESRAIVNVPLKPAPKPDAPIDSSAIAPAIDMQLTAPDLQGAESLVGPPRQKGDSAMKRILRAVSGKKDLP
jgi:hypothetical protein